MVREWVVDAGESGVVAAPVEPGDAGDFVWGEGVASGARELAGGGGGGRVRGGVVGVGHDGAGAVVGCGRLDVEGDFGSHDLPGASEWWRPGGQGSMVLGLHRDVEGWVVGCSIVSICRVRWDWSGVRTGDEVNTGKQQVDTRDMQIAGLELLGMRDSAFAYLLSPKRGLGQCMFSCSAGGLIVQWKHMRF